MAYWPRHDALLYNVDLKNVLNSCRDADLGITYASVEYHREDFQQFENLCKAFLHDDNHNHEVVLKHPG
jgi:hypothetical protein